jgi:hypothetical protein
MPRRTKVVPFRQTRSKCKRTTTRRQPPLNSLPVHAPHKSPLHHSRIVVQIAVEGFVNRCRANVGRRKHQIKNIAQSLTSTLPHKCPVLAWMLSVLVGPFMAVRWLFRLIQRALALFLAFVRIVLYLRSDTLFSNTRRSTLYYPTTPPFFPITTGETCSKVSNMLEGLPLSTQLRSSLKPGTCGILQRCSFVYSSLYAHIYPEGKRSISRN